MTDFENKLKTICNRLPRHKLKKSLWENILPEIGKKPNPLKKPVLVFAFTAAVILIVIFFPMKPKHNLSVEYKRKSSMYDYTKNSVFATLKYQIYKDEYGKSGL